MPFLKDSAMQIDHFISTIVEKEITLKPLFIGSGTFYDDVMFGIYVNDEFYLKAKGQFAALLIKNGAHPWCYVPKGKKLAMASYYKLPEGLCDNPELLRRVILLSIKQIQMTK